MADSTAGESKETIISSFTDQIFSAMLQEVLMDVVLQSHRDFMRSARLCTKCGANCGSSCHLRQEGALETIENDTQPNESLPTTQSNVSGTATPKHDGNMYFDCTVCQKKVASNRYAPHLSSCLGLDSRARRGAARNATSKNKLNVDNDHTGSPGAFSDRPSPSVDAPNGKAKSKSKPNKKSNNNSKDSTESSGSKRPSDSLTTSPAKKVKKQKSGLITNNHDSNGSDKKVALSVLSKLPNKGTTPASPSARSGSQFSGRESPAASVAHSVSVSSLTGHSPNGFVKPAIRRPSKPGSAEQIAKKLQSQQQLSLSSASESSVKSKPSEKEEGLIDVDGEEPDDSSSDSSDN